MAHVLVTGGTGTLGSALLPRLAARGHEVRSLSRHGASGPALGAVPSGVSHLRGDVRSGEGLAEAMAGMDAVIHAATSGGRSVEVQGTAKVVAAARTAGAHLIYMSIVGVDTMRFAYYRSKWDAEKLVESGGGRWTIQRATQFHDLLNRFLSWRVFPVTTHLSFQPVDTGDVSERLADLVDSGESGRAEDFGGPVVVPMRALAAARRRIAGSGTLLVPLPAVGLLGDFDRGSHLCPDHAHGRVTWEEWLRARVGS
ncbi:MAG TPA: NAD(P)H-binding protein [Acidimicrobiales bacterium]|jgi:uncharacterized protein YbjT (DUF2867 family)|nr:NAD(P)H-binding protein [Acidimicrobiales bacterium]